MRQTKAQVARKIDRLAQLRQEMSRIQDRANTLGLAIRAAGGGESARYRAYLKSIRAHTRRIKAHDQLVVARKPS